MVSASDIPILVTASTMVIHFILTITHGMVMGLTMVAITLPITMEDITPTMVKIMSVMGEGKDQALCRHGQVQAFQEEGPIRAEMLPVLREPFHQEEQEPTTEQRLLHQLQSEEVLPKPEQVYPEQNHLAEQVRSSQLKVHRYVPMLLYSRVHPPHVPNTIAPAEHILQAITIQG